MTWRDRIVNDGTNRESWLFDRHPRIGASDAAKLSKATSVDKYLAAKLASKTFHGNDFTESGHRWEPMMLAWAGIPENKALVHAPGNGGFAATPDGIAEIHGGRSLRLAECKAKHGVIVNGPSLGEWRQLAWQLLCFPEAIEVQFIWAELLDGDIRPGCHGEPKSITVRRDDPKIREVTPLILPIATDLLARLTAALAFEREMNAA